jgi:hypothetical protein
MIGCLEMEGGTCPLGQRMWSTCAWQYYRCITSPCRAPGSPVSICHNFILGIDNERLPSVIVAMGLEAGRLQAGGSGLECLNVSPPEQFGRHLLLQDI